MSTIVAVMAVIAVTAIFRAAHTAHGRAHRRNRRVARELGRLVTGFARTHPRFEEVRGDMADAIEAAVAAGRHMTIEQALEHAYAAALATRLMPCDTPLPSADNGASNLRPRGVSHDSEQRGAAFAS